MLLYINLTLQWLLHSWCCRSLGCSMLHHWPWHFPCSDFGILSCHCVSFSFKWCILTLTIKSVISPIELDYRKKDPITPFNWKDIFNLYENIHRKWEFIYHSFFFCPSPAHSSLVLSLYLTLIHSDTQLHWQPLIPEFLNHPRRFILLPINSL